LWSRPNIDKNRIKPTELPPLVRIVVAIDPAVSSTENSDETGIIVAGLGDDDEFYILDDQSGVMSPNRRYRSTTHGVPTVSWPKKITGASVSRDVTFGRFERQLQPGVGQQRQGDSRRTYQRAL
jgi:hypothetical protein